MKLLTALVAGLSVSLSAAAPPQTKIEVTYHSDPPGASVYENGRYWGVAPLKLKYALPGKFKECTTLNPVMVRWVSGAEASIDDLKACPENGKKLQFSFLRPTGIPGADIDARYAADLMHQTAARQAAAQQADADAAEAVRKAFPKRCVSTVIGAQIFTNCS